MVVNEWWSMVMIWLIPSGKRLHNNGKIHHAIHGKTHELSTGPFLKAMLVINRGSRHAALSLAARTVGLIQFNGSDSSEEIPLLGWQEPQVVGRDVVE